MKPLPSKRVVGERLRKLRGRRSLATVARDLSCTPMAVSLWERGLRMPRDETTIMLAAYYKRSVSSIFYK